MQSVLNKTRNYFRCLGFLYERGIKQEPCDIKLRDENGNPAGTTKGERIMGNIAVRTDNGIHTFNVYFQNLTADNKPNPQWKMACAMMDWTPEINSLGGEPTLVNIEGTVAINDYVGQDGEVKSTLRWSVRRANTKASPDDTKGTSLNAVAFIQSIEPETRVVGDDVEPTGRLKVGLLGVDGKGCVFPIKALVDEDLADDFDSNYEKGQTVNFDFDLIVRHVGGQQNKKKAFGKGASVDVHYSFDIQELMIVGADEPFEEVEDDDGETKSQWLNPVAIKKAINERNKMLDELKNKPVEKKSGSIREAKQKEKAKMAKPKTAVPDFDDGLDDDEIF